MSSISPNTVLCDDKDENTRRRAKPTATLMQLVLWFILTYISKEFSLFLPIFQSNGGAKTFMHAGYEYDEDNTSFDNTILTWGTDYIIATMMAYAAIQCLGAINPPKSLLSSSYKIDAKGSKSLRTRSAFLFLSYAISVLFGGYAHYTFTTVDELNSIPFRICWMICVGSVTAAGGIIGSVGSEIYFRFCMNHGVAQDKVNFRIMYIPDILWFIYGGFMTVVCIRGEMSYKRPACDIFVAGTSQFVPTAYCVLTVLSIKWPDDNGVASGMLKALKRRMRYTLYIGFVLNAPLLPSYPYLVQYTNLSLGMVNSLLHFNLTASWWMQAISLYQFCQVLNFVGDLKTS